MFVFFVSCQSNVPHSSLVGGGNAPQVGCQPPINRKEEEEEEEVVEEEEEEESAVVVDKTEAKGGTAVHRG